MHLMPNLIAWEGSSLDWASDLAMMREKSEKYIQKVSYNLRIARLVVCLGFMATKNRPKLD